MLSLLSLSLCLTSKGLGKADKSELCLALTAISFRSIKLASARPDVLEVHEEDKKQDGEYGGAYADDGGWHALLRQACQATP